MGAEKQRALRRQRTDDDSHCLLYDFFLPGSFDFISLLYPNPQKLCNLSQTKRDYFLICINLIFLFILHTYNSI